MRFCCIIAAISLLSACASLPPSTPMTSATTSPKPTASPSNASANELQNWQGRFSAVIEQQDGKRQSIPGSFSLSSQKDRTLLELSSPLGQLVARLTVTPSIARLETADRGEYSAPDVDQLTEEVLGWRIPALRLPIWLRGHAAGGSAFDAKNRLVRAEDHGWVVQVDEHNEQGKPKRLLLTWQMDNSQATAARNQTTSVRLRLIVE
jgi:outer membrane lipoprotein LolB